jgi:hypothetical protein
MRALKLVSLALAGFVVAAPVGAQSVRCTSQEIGNMTYTSCSDGTRSTSQRIGNQTYTNGSNGTRATTQDIGNTSYYNDNRGVRAQTQIIGNSSYTNITTPAGSARATTQSIGGMSYLNGTTGSGSSVNGSSQRIGTTTYSSFRVQQPVVPRAPVNPYAPPIYTPFP